MKAKFTKAGSSVAAIIPSTILKALNIDSKRAKFYDFDLKFDEDNRKIILSGFILNADREVLNI